MEIAALCQFLANALRGADSFDLLVLKELVETLTGISVPPDLSAEQVRQAGGASCTQTGRGPGTRQVGQGRQAVGWASAHAAGGRPGRRHPRQRGDDP